MAQLFDGKTDSMAADVLNSIQWEIRYGALRGRAPDSNAFRAVIPNSDQSEGQFSITSAPIAGNQETVIHWHKDEDEIRFGIGSISEFSNAPPQVRQEQLDRTLQVAPIVSKTLEIVGKPYHQGDNYTAFQDPNTGILTVSAQGQKEPLLMAQKVDGQWKAMDVELANPYEPNLSDQHMKNFEATKQHLTTHFQSKAQRLSNPSAGGYEP